MIDKPQKTDRYGRDVLEDENGYSSKIEIREFKDGFLVTCVNEQCRYGGHLFASYDSITRETRSYDTLESALEDVREKFKGDEYKRKLDKRT